MYLDYIIIKSTNLKKKYIIKKEQYKLRLKTKRSSDKNGYRRICCIKNIRVNVAYSDKYVIIGTL